MKIPTVKYFGLTSQSNVKPIQTIKASNKCGLDFWVFFGEDFFSSSLNSFPHDSCCQDHSFIAKKTCVGWKFMRRFWSFWVQQLPMFCSVLIEELSVVK